LHTAIACLHKASHINHKTVSSLSSVFAHTHTREREFSLGLRALRALYCEIPMSVPTLNNSVTWMVGGVGLIGQGITRALLRAGATVIVNSRSENRLSTLSDTLGHPERLITLNKSMLPAEAEATVALAMERTGGQLDHVVAHSAVRWWDAATGDDGAMVNELAPSRTGNFLDVDPKHFAKAVSKSSELHFCAAHHLIPRLKNSEGASYTFVTGGNREISWRPAAMREAQRGPLAQINSYGVWGLAAALRGELQPLQSPVRVQEVRVGGGSGGGGKPAWVADRTRRKKPLSQCIGSIVAGMAAANPATGAGISDAAFQMVCTGIPALLHHTQPCTHACTSAPVPLYTPLRGLNAHQPKPWVHEHNCPHRSKAMRT
jgi:NAD(P)-dependent dehydrogenase (short-subunit alcohol dehydrogenase family)